MRNALHAIVLDFDGVVLESNDLKTNAFAHVFSRFPDHVDAMMAYHHAHVSASRFNKFEHLVRDRLGRRDDEPLVAELAAAFSQFMRERLKTCPPVPGALAFLAEFSGRVPLFVVSATPEPELLAVLEERNLAKYFTGVFGCPPWTKPAAVKASLARAGAAPGEAVMVGDSAGDWGAAQEAGIEFIGRDSGLPFPPGAPAPMADLHAVAAALRHRIEA